MRDFYRFKSRIDQVRKSYGVVVKGQRLPSPQESTTPRNDRFVFIEASSYAMANCMEIPKKFDKNDRHPWYLDERVSSRLDRLPPQPASRLKIPLLPDKKERYIYAYDDLMA